jgi:hypothetical protein
MDIHLGFEVGTGRAVAVPTRHLAVTGQTQDSGKTTTLEALIARSGLRAVAFVTKRGEGSFRTGRKISPYFRERADWQFVQSVLEAAMHQRMKFEQQWIIQASKGAKTLREVHQNVQRLMLKAKGLSFGIYTCLDAYFSIVIPQIDRLPYSKKLELAPGINVMDLSGYDFPLQALVVRSVLEWVYENERDTVVIIPEAWEFIPQDRGSPVRLAAEELIRKGAANRNFVWIDSQDLAGVHKTILRQVGVWIVGVQREANEIARVLKHFISKPARPRPEEIMTLGRGEFFACWGTEQHRVYVQPAWIGEVHARAIAMGEESVESAAKIWREMKKESKSQKPAASHDESEDSEEDMKLLEEIRAALECEPGKEAEKLKELIVAHDALAKEVRSFHALNPQLAHDLRAPAIELPPIDLQPNEAPAGSVQTIAIPPNGRVDLPAIYAYVKQRAAADPGVLELLRQQPELRVKVERRTLTVSDADTDGRIALLIKDKFFDTPQNSGAVTKEFKRRGWFQAKTSNAATLKPLFRIAEAGFLVKEAGGYQAVPGMKVHIAEA